MAFAALQALDRLQMMLYAVCMFARSPAVIAVIVIRRRYGSITVNKGMLSTFEGLFLPSNARH